MQPSPRDILAVAFPSRGFDLPINGGWGMVQEDACVIDKEDPAALPGFSFDPWRIIFTFVEERNYMELVITREEGKEFSGIAWELLERKTVRENGRVFEWLNFEVSGFRDDDWKSLQAEWEAGGGLSSPDFDLEAHMQRRNECKVTRQRPFWFDVTSSYSSSLYGINLPWVVGEYARGAIVDYESTTPGQGYSLAYSPFSGRGVTSTVYFYVGAHQEIPDDIESELVVEHFKDLIQEVLSANEMIFKRKCEFKGAAYVGEEGCQPIYLGADFDLEGEAEPIKTRIFLKTYDGRFLKIRQTFPEDERFQRMSIDFAIEFSKMLNQ